MVRLFFATDIQGSELGWKKLLAAGKTYGTDILILGGNIAARGLHFIVQENGKWTTRYVGKKYRVDPGSGLEHLEERIRTSGCMPCRITLEEREELEGDPQKVASIYEQAAKNTLERWFAQAESALSGTNQKLFLIPGNSDSISIERLLDGFEHLVWAQRKVLSLDNHHQMVSEGWSHKTPWQGMHEVEEEQLYEIMESQVHELNDLYHAVFNLHPPPYNCRIDNAPLSVDSEWNPNEVRFAPVGSRAVRRLIETYQPALSLHGMVHSARGFCRLGRTLCLNPGSFCNDGILSGFLVVLDESGVRSFQPVQG